MGEKMSKTHHHVVRKHPNTLTKSRKHKTKKKNKPHTKEIDHCIRVSSSSSSSSSTTTPAAFVISY